MKTIYACLIGLCFVGCSNSLSETVESDIDQGMDLGSSDAGTGGTGGINNSSSTGGGIGGSVEEWCGNCVKYMQEVQPPGISLNGCTETTCDFFCDECMVDLDDNVANGCEGIRCGCTCAIVWQIQDLDNVASMDCHKKTCLPDNKDSCHQNCDLICDSGFIDADGIFENGCEAVQ